MNWYYEGSAQLTLTRNTTLDSISQIHIPNSSASFDKPILDDFLLCCHWELPFLEQCCSGCLEHNQGNPIPPLWGQVSRSSSNLYTLTAGHVSFVTNVSTAVR